MESHYVDFINDLLITIHSNIKELRERKNFADEVELNHIEAKLLAYQEILSAMQSGAEEFGLPKGDLGL